MLFDSARDKTGLYFSYVKAAKKLQDQFKGCPMAKKKRYNKRLKEIAKLVKFEEHLNKFM